MDTMRNQPYSQEQAPTPSSQTPFRAQYDRTPTNHDLAKCLARNQLVTSGIIIFDDKPENYWAWKSSFESATAGLDLTAGEELDLLSKWLGQESSQHVRRIKAVNIRRPQTGLDMAWERLEETYGSSEAIERALFSKLEHFPKLSNRTAKAPRTWRPVDGGQSSEARRLPTWSIIPGHIQGGSPHRRKATI
jgi:hypothetical protein